MFRRATFSLILSIFDFFGSFFRLEDLSLKQDKEKSDKITTWEIWIIRIRELQDKCQAKTKKLKAASEPQNKKDVEEQMILVKVRTQFPIFYADHSVNNYY